MNNDRRKTIATLIKELSDVQDSACELQLAAEDLRDRIEAVRDEEQEYYDNMPESFQAGDKGAIAEEAIAVLETAFDQADELVNSLESAVDQAAESVDALTEIK